MGTAGFKSYREPFFEMIPYQKDRQNRLPLFYRNNTQKRDGIVPNIVPNIVPTELQKPLFCAAIGKRKRRFTSTEKYLTKS